MLDTTFTYAPFAARRTPTPGSAERGNSTHHTQYVAHNNLIDLPDTGIYLPGTRRRVVALLPLIKRATAVDRFGYQRRRNFGLYLAVTLDERTGLVATERLSASARLEVVQEEAA